jgi:hypothetical protein
MGLPVGLLVGGLIGWLVQQSHKIHSNYSPPEQQSTYHQGTLGSRIINHF